MAYLTRSNISAPAQIKCSRCSIVKSKDAFSVVQQKNLVETYIKASASFDPRKQGAVPCSSCSGTQVFELYCHICDKVKAKDRFAKAQRKDPDHAICWPCRQERDNMEPGADSSDENSVSDDGSLESLSSADSGDDVATTITGTSGMTQSKTGTFASQNNSTMSKSGGVSLAGYRSGGSSVPPSKAYGASAAYHRPAPAASTISSPSVKSTGTAITTRSNATTATSDSGKFAKIRAVKRTVQYDAAREPMAAGGNDIDEDDENYFQDDE